MDRVCQRRGRWCHAGKRCSHKGGGEWIEGGRMREESSERGREIGRVG